jgi:ferredoxin
MKIAADLELCIGAGVCVLTAPDVFDQNPEDGRVTLRTEYVSGDAAALARVAVDRCPSGALSIEDDEGPA